MDFEAPVNKDMQTNKKKGRERITTYNEKGKTLNMIARTCKAWKVAVKFPDFR